MKTATIAAASLLLLCGCQTKGLFFGTENRWGLNVAGSPTAPATVSLDYHRGEAAIVPKGADGEAHAVYGGSDHDFSWGKGMAISQTFATGDAAIIAAGGTVEKEKSEKAGPAEPLFFVTGTTYGLNLHLAEGADQSPGMIAGFKRAEAVWIPTPPGAVQADSVYADISIVYLPDSASPPSSIAPERAPRITGGSRIKQQFATGAAARTIAERPDVRAKLDVAAGVATPATQLAARTEYATKLAAVTDEPTRRRILERAKGALATDQVTVPDPEQPGAYANFVNAIVPNLQPGPLARLQTALKGLVP